MVDKTRPRRPREMGCTFEYSHGRGKVIDSSGGSEGGGDDGGRGDKIVGKGIVQVALQLEDVLDLLEFLFVSVESHVSACGPELSLESKCGGRVCPHCCAFGGPATIVRVAGSARGPGQGGLPTSQ